MPSCLQFPFFFEIILTLKPFTGEVGVLFAGYGSPGFERGFSGSDFPALEMKTLPEKPASSFVLFKTARFDRVGGYCYHVGF
jgi:hypothetical protein